MKCLPMFDLLKRKKYNAKSMINRGSNDSLSLSDHIGVNVGLYFELKQKVYIGGNMTNAPNMELVLDEDKNYLKGFVIKVQSTDEQSIKNAAELANRFTNYL